MEIGPLYIYGAKENQHLCYLEIEQLALRLLASYLMEVKRRVLAPKILLEGNDKLKLVTSFCHVSNRQFAGNRRQLSVASVRKTTIANDGINRFIEGH